MKLANQGAQSTPFRTAVIGLGAIGQGYDANLDPRDHVLTHARGVSLHPGFDLVGGVDPDAEARKKFEALYAKPAFSTLQELGKIADPRIFSIGVPTAQHAAVFSEALSFSPWGVLCEKPIAMSVAEGRRMVKQAEDKKCLFAVNYMRRSEPGVQTLRKSIRAGDFGEIYKGTVWYSKGIRNNGSHWIDLLMYLLGDVTHVEVISPGRVLGSDPEPDVRICFGSAEIYFLAGREEHFSANQIELMGSQGVIQYLRGGAEIRRYKIRAAKISGYRELDPDPEVIPSDLKKYQSYVLDGFYNSLREAAPLVSDGKSSLKTLEVVEQAIDLWKESQATSR